MTKKGHSEIFAWKIELFRKLVWKSRKVFRNLPGKIGFFTWTHDPQISNQIDAAVIIYIFKQPVTIIHVCSPYNMFAWAIVRTTLDIVHKN